MSPLKDNRQLKSVCKFISSYQTDHNHMKLQINSKNWMFFFPALVFHINVFGISTADSTIYVEGKTVRSHLRAEPGDSLPNGKWIQLFNEYPDKLASLYQPNAVIQDGNGAWIESPLENRKYLPELKLKVGTIRSFQSLHCEQLEPGLIVEASRITNLAGASFQQLVIWRHAGQSFSREVEMLSASALNSIDTTGVSRARLEWMNLCNSHDVDNLVKQRYFEDATYYNQQRLIRGTNAIIQQYKYMRDVNYQLTLIPKFVQPVNDKIIFEIGRCDGSYKGNYILVWGKKGDGNWKILFDSN